MSSSVQIADALGVGAANAVEKASRALLSLQKPEGYWWADLTADSTLESDFILLELWKNPPVHGVWNPPSRALIDKAVRSIFDRQLADGGFNIYPQGPSEISASVKAYFALKVSGIPASDPRLERARTRILALGGLQAANSYVKVNLSLFNLFPRQHAPAIPPELMLFGNLIYEMSSWTRAIVIALSIVHALNPGGRPVPAGFTLDELHKPGVSFELPNNKGFFSWRNFFITGDRILKLWERHGSKAIRRKALKKAEAWLIEHTRHSDGLGAIYPSMQYAIMAFDLLGYPESHPLRVEAQKQFDRLLTDDGERFFFQPCFSPVWDSAIAAFALGESGLAPQGSMERCASWLLSKEVRRKGDWSVKRPNLEPSGWYFEFANEFYPDIDDTAMVLLSFRHAQAADSGAQRASIRRAVDWLLGMQGKDGGWAAFDVDNDWTVLNEVPFADHNAMLDPSCPDITGRVIEALCAHGVAPDSPAIRRGVDYLIRTQEQDGSWYGRWGVDYIYGTFLALRGLKAAGESDREAYVLRGGEWLRSVQNGDGGWGESCASYQQNTFVPAASTPSQTAWAILGLLAGGDNDSQSARKGVEFLLKTQGADGRWREDLSTGTGFPRVFYLTYHLYRDAFPLMALSGYLSGRDRRGELA